MLIDQINTGIKTAMKNQDKVRLETLRFLVSAIRYLAIDKYQAQGMDKLTDADVIDVVTKQVKSHRESIEAFEKGNRKDLVEKEQAQLKILMEFMPQELSDQELEKLLMPLINSGTTNFGPLMGQAMKLVNGRASGQRVSKLLNRLMSANQT